MIKPILHLRVWLVFVVCAVASAFSFHAQAQSYPSDDRLVVSDLQEDEDGTYFVVSLEGNEDITYCAYNMNLHLPPGISVARDEDGLMIWLNNEDGFYPQKKGQFSHLIGSNYVNGKYKIIVYSFDNSEFKKTGGALMYVYVDISPWAKAGLNEVMFETIKFVEKSEVGHIPADGVAGTITVSAEGREVPVSITAENQIGTCILPFDYTLPEGAVAYEAADCDGEYLYLSPVETMEAYKPYILHSELGFSATLTGDAVESAFPGTATVNVSGLCGAIAPTEVTEGYILQNKGAGDGPCFYRVGDTPYSIKAGKCFLAPVSSAQCLAPRFNGGAGIADIEAAAPADGIVYDLNGRPVANPSPGNIYILNGQKILKMR